jgi:GNAT superfamily N-acetyltransferase
MHIRPGTTQDHCAIQAFDCFGGNRLAALDEGRCLVAVVDKNIAGFVSYQRGGLIGKDFIEYLVVNEPYRRKNVAVSLLRAAESELAPGRLFISTEAENTPMLALLDKEGWTAAGQIDHINASGHAERFFFADLPRQGTEPKAS